MTPSPVQHLAALGHGRTALWVKRDDLNHPLYGGNKVRKLRFLLREAELADARRLLLLAPAGSHQVLATAIFAAEAGLPVTAVLSPQPRTDHAAQVLRAIVGLGVEVIPSSASTAGVKFLRARRPGDFVVPLGGSSTHSLRGHIEAAGELRRAVTQGEIPPPDVVVVPLASAGTAVALAAGMAAHALDTPVLAVCTNDRPIAARVMVATQLAKLRRLQPSLVTSAVRGLSLDGSQLGGGYGVSTPASRRAMALGAVHGLSLDPAYTAKSFAAALALVARGAHTTVLFWQTHASAPLDRWLTRAPAERELPAPVRALLLPSEEPCASS